MNVHSYHEGEGKCVTPVAKKPEPAPTHFVIADRQHSPNRHDPLGCEGRYVVIGCGDEKKALGIAKAFVEGVGGQVTVVSADAKVNAKAKVEVL